MFAEMPLDNRTVVEFTAGRVTLRFGFGYSGRGLVRRLNVSSRLAVL